MTKIVANKDREVRKQWETIAASLTKIKYMEALISGKHKQAGSGKDFTPLGETLGEEGTGFKHQRGGLTGNGPGARRQTERASGKGKIETNSLQAYFI